MHSREIPRTSDPGACGCLLHYFMSVLPTCQAQQALRDKVPELFDVLQELNVDIGSWNVMAALADENSAMAREFLFFCERSLGFGSLRMQARWANFT